MKCVCAGVCLYMCVCIDPAPDFHYIFSQCAGSGQAADEEDEATGT